ncbi:MAG TPA: dihydroxyacetone kinase subunit DhaL [Chthoniobacterales bacterium]|nr:dihydroxyacetone kinase subunit DhaL [Chthoniobacterales bacterium]
MKSISQSDIERAVHTVADTVITNENYFSELDGTCGDGDFGTSLATGFRFVLSKWDSLDRSSIGTFLSGIGVIITSNVGGCSGPLWGTGFIRAGALSREKDSITLSELGAMLRNSMAGIQARGGASLGDKTILDALEPIAATVERRAQDPECLLLATLREATDKATAAIEATRPWTARRGRQSFTGERSAGTLDPGIVAIATIMQALTARFAPVTSL